MPAKPDFANRLYKFLSSNDTRPKHIVWGGDGTTVLITNAKAFDMEDYDNLLPRKFDTFKRQLRNYGFKNLRDKRRQSAKGCVDSEWQHPDFRRDKPDLAFNIHPKPVVAPSDENDHSPEREDSASETPSLDSLSSDGAEQQSTPALPGIDILHEPAIQQQSLPLPTVDTSIQSSLPPQPQPSLSSQSQPPLQPPLKPQLQLLQLPRLLPASIDRLTSTSSELTAFSTTETSAAPASQTHSTHKLSNTSSSSSHVLNSVTELPTLSDSYSIDPFYSQIQPTSVSILSTNALTTPSTSTNSYEASSLLSTSIASHNLTLPTFHNEMATATPTDSLHVDASASLTPCIDIHTLLDIIMHDYNISHPAVGLANEAYADQQKQEDKFMEMDDRKVNHVIDDDNIRKNEHNHMLFLKAGRINEFFCSNKTVPGHISYLFQHLLMYHSGTLLSDHSLCDMVLNFRPDIWGDLTSSFFEPHKTPFFVLILRLSIRIRQRLPSTFEYLLLWSYDLASVCSDNVTNTVYELMRDYKHVYAGSGQDTQFYSIFGYCMSKLESHNFVVDVAMTPEPAKAIDNIRKLADQIASRCIFDCSGRWREIDPAGFPADWANEPNLVRLRVAMAMRFCTTLDYALKQL
ncbi:hypothetical protein GQ42DRAFT_165848 [Ramicandelaber brevisporus]|nr:hypothetical protein GQ42DRAFT_165848 [Ramicandelaber brevisporus]